MVGGLAQNLGDLKLNLDAEVQLWNELAYRMQVVDEVFVRLFHQEDRQISVCREAIHQDPRMDQVGCQS